MKAKSVHETSGLGTGDPKNLISQPLLNIPYISIAMSKRAAVNSISAQIGDMRCLSRDHLRGLNAV